MANDQHNSIIAARNKSIKVLAYNLKILSIRERWMRYAVKLLKDNNDTILATVPDIPEAITFGENREDALARALDAIETAIMGMITAGVDIPIPKTKGKEYVSLPALTCAKIELYKAMRKSKVGKAAMAKRLGIALPQIYRLLDLSHQSRLDAIERALASLGRSITITVKTAI